MRRGRWTIAARPPHEARAGGWPTGRDVAVDVVGPDSLPCRKSARVWAGDHLRVIPRASGTVTNSRATDGWAIALDGGTTNTRARLLRDGRIVAVARRTVGVRDAALSAGLGPLAGAVR